MISEPLWWRQRRVSFSENDGDCASVFGRRQSAEGGFISNTRTLLLYKISLATNTKSRFVRRFVLYQSEKMGHRGKDRVWARVRSGKKENANKPDKLKERCGGTGDGGWRKHAEHQKVLHEQSCRQMGHPPAEIEHCNGRCWVKVEIRCDDASIAAAERRPKEKYTHDQSRWPSAKDKDRTLRARRLDKAFQQ